MGSLLAGLKFFSIIFSMLLEKNSTYATLILQKITDQDP